MIPVVRKIKLSFHIQLSTPSFPCSAEHAEQLPVWHWAIPGYGCAARNQAPSALCLFFLFDILSIRCMCSFCTVRPSVFLTKLVNWFSKHSFKIWMVPLFSCLWWNLCGRGFSMVSGHFVTQWVMTCFNSAVLGQETEGTGAALNYFWTPVKSGAVLRCTQLSEESRAASRSHWPLQQWSGNLVPCPVCRALYKWSRATTINFMKFLGRSWEILFGQAGCLLSCPAAACVL